jgi:hypothetical protein
VFDPNLYPSFFRVLRKLVVRTEIEIRHGEIKSIALLFKLGPDGAADITGRLEILCNSDGLVDTIIATFTGCV